MTTPPIDETTESAVEDTKTLNKKLNIMIIKRIAMKILITAAVLLGATVLARKLSPVEDEDEDQTED